MNELDKALAELLTKAVEGAEQAGDFLLSEIPDVAQQVLTYALVSEGLLALFLSLICAVAARFGIRCCKRLPDAADHVETDNLIGGMIVSGFVFLVLLPGVVITFGDFLKVWLAPKVYLIEYAAELVR